MERYFKKEDQQQDFENHGYTTAPMLDSSEIKRLIDIYHEFNEQDKKGFYASLFESNFELKRKIDQAIGSVIEDKILAILNDCHPVIASFVVKSPGAAGLVYPHQDWTFVDEREYCSLNVWIPLQDTGYDNGTLHLLPDSHKLPFTYRGTNIVSAIVGAPKVPLHTMQCMTLMAGEALIYDHRMIHASPPNRSNAIRYGVALVIVPATAQLIHVARINDKFYKYHIDKEFFYRQMCIDDYNMTMPEGYEPVQEVDYKEYSFTNSMLFPRDTWMKRIRRRLVSSPF